MLDELSGNETSRYRNIIVIMQILAMQLCNNYTIIIIIMDSGQSGFHGGNVLMLPILESCLQ